MKILIDTREQLPLEFQHEFITEVKRVKLEVGDYSAEFEDGYQPPIYFERKSIGDLFGTLTSGYERFKKEIIRSQSSNISLIILIECIYSKVLSGYKHSTVEGLSIVRKLMTLRVKYGIGFVCCKDREEMAHYITEFYVACGKQHMEHKKKSE